MATIKIQRISHQSELSPAGGVRKIVRIDFRVADDGPFNLSFPEDTYNDADAYAAIQTYADGIDRLRSRTQGGPTK